MLHFTVLTQLLKQKNFSQVPKQTTLKHGSTRLEEFLSAYRWQMEQLSLLEIITF